MVSLTTKLAIAGGMTVVLVSLGYVALDNYGEALKAEAYNDGVSDTNAENARLSAMKQLADQKKLDKIALDAKAQIASQTATNVQKAIADARKANPECLDLTVPRSVLDELRRNK